jgi:hypothetical protein
MMNQNQNSTQPAVLRSPAWMRPPGGLNLATFVSKLLSTCPDSGNRSRVAQVYQRCRQALFTDLGVEASPTTRRLYERLRQDGPEPPVTAEAPRVVDDGHAQGVPPYRGLLWYDEADADSFFGRERLTAQLLSRFRSEPFLAVIGASGSGKSHWCGRAWSRH